MSLLFLYCNNKNASDSIIQNRNNFHCEIRFVNEIIIKHLTVISCKWLRFSVGSALNAAIAFFVFFFILLCCCMWIVSICNFPVRRINYYYCRWWLANLQYIGKHAIFPFTFSLNKYDETILENLWTFALQWLKCILRRSCVSLVFFHF